MKIDFSFQKQDAYVTAFVLLSVWSICLLAVIPANAQQTLTLLYFKTGNGKCGFKTKSRPNCNSSPV